MMDEAKGESSENEMFHGFVVPRSIACYGISVLEDP
ncbi:MAG: hypothetical protein HW407_2322 [Bacteroidetes bacterium]|nr:hypothetical protein [Bacteroidota bacterium]